MKLAYVPSRRGAVTQFYSSLERSLEKMETSPRVLLVVPGKEIGVATGCSTRISDLTLRSYVEKIGSVTQGVSSYSCEEKECASNIDLDLHLGFIQRLGLRFSPISIERQNENVFKSVGTLISKMINLIDDMIVIVVGPTERVEFSSLQSKGKNASTNMIVEAKCGESEDIHCIQAMLNEITSIQQQNHNDDLTECRYVMYTTTSIEKKHDDDSLKNHVAIPNIDNILGPM